MKIKDIIFGLLIYCLFSFSSVVMKIASSQNTFINKLFYFFISIMILGTFSLLWQKLLKKLDLNKAYIFKGTTLLWGVIFGNIFFHEKISFNMFIGVIVCLIGTTIAIGEENEK